MTMFDVRLPCAGYRGPCDGTSLHENVTRTELRILRAHGTLCHECYEQEQRELGYIDEGGEG